MNEDVAIYVNKDIDKYFSVLKQSNVVNVQMNIFQQITSIKYLSYQESRIIEIKKTTGSMIGNCVKILFCACFSLTYPHNS